MNLSLQKKRSIINGQLLSLNNKKSLLILNNDGLVVDNQKNRVSYGLFNNILAMLIHVFFYCFMIYFDRSTNLYSCSCSKPKKSEIIP